MSTALTKHVAPLSATQIREDIVRETNLRVKKFAEYIEPEIERRLKGMKDKQKTSFYLSGNSLKEDFGSLRYCKNQKCFKDMVQRFFERGIYVKIIGTSRENNSLDVDIWLENPNSVWANDVRSGILRYLWPEPKPAAPNKIVNFISKHIDMGAVAYFCLLAPCFTYIYFKLFY